MQGGYSVETNVGTLNFFANESSFFTWDSNPVTITAHEHRPAYSSDGDYFSNPNAEDVFEVVYGIMHEVDPEKYPVIY